MDNPNISRMEIEYNRNWINSYPDLFMKSLHKWHRETDDLELKSRRVDQSRKGSVIYIAEK